jgi:alkylation response protein AidB-like acyl-CoA dehydrogenase
MNLDWTPEQEAFRAEARAWLRANVPQGLPSGDTREGFAAHVKWEKQLFAAGWSAVAWPAAFGGRGASLFEWLIFEEEYWKAGGPIRVTQNGIFLLAPAIFEFGTEEQKARLLRPMAAADYLWAQGWSEPESGSDLASVRATATRVDGGWRVYGQKTWTTRGAFCDGTYGLFRTEPGSVRHKGLSYMLVDLHQPGVTVRPVERLDGDESFAEVFLDGAFVPDRDVLGPVGDGWRIAMSTTSSERGLSLRSPGRFQEAAARLIALYRQRPDPALREAVARCWIDAEAYNLFTLGTVSRMSLGHEIGADSSLNKIFWSEMDIRITETALQLLGPSAELMPGSPAAFDDGRWLTDFLFALAGPIYAGTNEIQRNIVASRVLDLPR